MINCSIELYLGNRGSLCSLRSDWVFSPYIYPKIALFILYRKLMNTPLNMLSTALN